MECQCNNEPSTITAKPLQSSISRPLKEQSNSCPGSSRILVRPLRAGFIHQQHPTWRDDGNECHVDSESSTARGKDQSTDSCNECEHCSNAPCPQTETPDHEILPSPWFEQHTRWHRVQEDGEHRVYHEGKGSDASHDQQQSPRSSGGWCRGEDVKCRRR